MTRCVQQRRSRIPGFYFASFLSKPESSTRSQLRGGCSPRALRDTRVRPCGHALHLPGCRSRLFEAALVRRIFPAVDRCDMGRVPAEIGASDSELLDMRINPRPKLIRGSPSLVARFALHAHDIRRQPAAITAAQAAAMKRPVARRLEAACDRLAEVIPECAGDAGRKARHLRRAKHIKQFQP